ncbi:redoxin domain-containing protein [Rhizobiales bacterium]|uniref:redoxin domain-containing protein n=1 Tax=Hongsoonwoonella zoysiae TaxID=2821844 RepID=UPI001560A306|nr:redoxin domain-containing protein [Hongsoonwoonella zoysiae]NRG16224.1 redoxin domain-containing protein [Hongsoonwoonella zoysiae]
MTASAIERADACATQSVRLRSGEQVPELDVPLARGGRWKLSEQRPKIFTLILAFRGLHCSFCKQEIQALRERLPELDAIGMSVVAVSMDDAERAATALREWSVGDVPFGYGLTEEQARDWGLYISRKIKPAEPETFCEPGAYLVRPDGTLYAQFQSTAPWFRLDLDIFLRGVQLSIERGTPPRGAE